MQLLPSTYLNWEEALIREFCVFPELRTPIVEALPETASVDHGNVRVFLVIFSLGKIFWGERLSIDLDGGWEKENVFFGCLFSTLRKARLAS